MITRTPFRWALAATLVVSCGAPSHDVGSDPASTGGVRQSVPLRECDLPIDNPLKNWLDRRELIALSGTLESAAEPELTPSVYGPIDVRALALADVKILADMSVDNERSKDMVLAISDKYGSTTNIDGDKLVGQNVILLGSASSDRSAPSFLVGAAVVGDGQRLSFPGTCDSLLSNQADEMVAILNSQGFDVTGATALESWIQAISEGSDTKPYESASAAAMDTTSKATWEESSVVSRGLSPDVVPAGIAKRLDVVGVFVDVADLPPEMLLAIRTESGVSAATRVGNSASPIPGYLVRGVDTNFTVSVAPMSDNLSSVGTNLAQVPILDFNKGAGLLISGSYSDASIRVSILSIDEVAKRMNASIEILEAERQRLLAPPIEASTDTTP